MKIDEHRSKSYFFGSRNCFPMLPGLKKGQKQQKSFFFFSPGGGRWMAGSFFRGEWGTPWGSPGDHLGALGDPWGFLGDPFGKTWGPSGTSWDPLGTPWRALWDHLEVLLDTLGVSWGFFRGNLELQGAPSGFQRGSRRALGGILGALWRLRNGLQSNSLQYAKTFKSTVRYCKNRGLGTLKALKICSKSIQTHQNSVEKRKVDQ